MSRQPGESVRDFWNAGPEIDQLEFRPFAADDPAALPRSRGRLPGDGDGGATEDLLQLYAVLADAAESEAFGDRSG